MDHQTPLELSTAFPSTAFKFPAVEPRFSTTCTVTATQFGAVADGITDNTVALQAMLDHVKEHGGTARFDGCGVGVYLTGHLLIQGPLTKPITIESDPHVWLARVGPGHYNMLDILDCENISLGNLNIDCRYSAWADDNDPAVNSGYAMTIRRCSNITHNGRLRAYDFQEAFLIYDGGTIPPGDPPRYHDVTLDYVEMKCPIVTDDAGHWISGGRAMAGIIFVDMAKSGARFVFAEGIMTDNPGYTMEFKNNCHDCWYGGYIIKQCVTGVSFAGASDVVSAERCFVGSGICDQVQQALTLSHSKHCLVSHMRARAHPDLPFRDPADDGYPWFVQLTGGLQSDCSLTVEIVDYDGGPDDVPPIKLGGDRNALFIPWINNAVPVYADVSAGASHCSISIWQDVSLGSVPDLGSKFVDASIGDTNNYYVAGAGFGWRQGAAGGFKIDSNEVSVLDIGGSPGMRGDGYLALDAEEYRVGVQVDVPATGFNQSVPGHIGVYVLEPAGTLATGRLVLPATPADGKQQTIVSTQTVTAFTLSTDGVGHSIVGAVTTLTANTPVRYVFNEAGLKWYRS